MPLVNIKVFEERLEDSEFAEKLTLAVADAVVSVCGEEAREHTWVFVEGVPGDQWLIGGKRIQLPL